MTDEHVSNDGTWWICTGPSLGDCVPVMISNIGWEHGFCEVTVTAWNRDRTPAADVMITTALFHKGEWRGFPNEAEWEETEKIVGDIDYLGKMIVWFTAVNGRDEPFSMSLRGLTV